MEFHWRKHDREPKAPKNEANKATNLAFRYVADGEKFAKREDLAFLLQLDGEDINLLYVLCGSKLLTGDRIDAEAILKDKKATLTVGHPRLPKIFNPVAQHEEKVSLLQEAERTLTQARAGALEATHPTPEDKQRAHILTLAVANYFARSTNEDQDNTFVQLKKRRRTWTDEWGEEWVRKIYGSEEATADVI